MNVVGLKVQHVRAARGQVLINDSVAPLREGGCQKQTSLPANSVGKAGRPFEKPAVVVGVMPSAKRVLVQLSRRHVAWCGMVEVCEGAPVAVSGWVLTDRHDARPCAASGLHQVTMSVSNVIGGMVWHDGRGL